MIEAASAVARAIGQLPESGMRRPLLLSIGWTTLAFVLLWGGIGFLLDSALAANPLADWVGRILGILATPILTFLLFPFVATAIAGIYSDRIALAVELRHYPNLPPPPPTNWGDQIRSVVSLMLLSLVLNLAIIPFYLFLPGANVILFGAMNGYILGRGYFDLVALRRLSWSQSRQLWKHLRLEFWLAGAATALLFVIPMLGLLSPLIGTAASVHLLASDVERRDLKSGDGQMPVSAA